LKNISEKKDSLSNDISLIQQIEEIIANEIKSDDIASINKDFYSKITNKIGNIKESGNLIKLLNLLQYIRLVKILGKFFLGVEIDEDKLSVEEVEVLKHLKKIYSKYISREKVVETVEKEEETKLALVVFKEPLHKVYLENLILGPFSKGDVVVLPLKALRVIPSDKITLVEVLK